MMERECASAKCIPFQHPIKMFAIKVNATIVCLSGGYRSPLVFGRFRRCPFLFSAMSLVNMSFFFHFPQFLQGKAKLLTRNMPRQLFYPAFPESFT
jgi:hypothetical protein